MDQPPLINIEKTDGATNEFPAACVAGAIRIVCDATVFFVVPDFDNAASTEGESSAVFIALL